MQDNIRRLSDTRRRADQRLVRLNRIWSRRLIVYPRTTTSCTTKTLGYSDLEWEPGATVRLIIMTFTLGLQ